MVWMVKINGMTTILNHRITIRKSAKDLKPRLVCSGIIIVVLLIGVSIAGWGSTLKTSGSNSTAGWGSNFGNTYHHYYYSPIQTQNQSTTSADSKPLTCEEKWVGEACHWERCNYYQPIETLIAEFQYRYFDLRDGTAD